MNLPDHKIETLVKSFFETAEKENVPVVDLMAKSILALKVEVDQLRHIIARLDADCECCAHNVMLAGCNCECEKCQLSCTCKTCFSGSHYDFKYKTEATSDAQKEPPDE